MKQFIYIVVVCVMAFGVTACGEGSSFSKRMFTPHSMSIEPPEGPPEYRQGYTDGCESGMAAYSNSLAKSLGVFKLRQDPQLRNNRMYYQIWKDAFLYCAIYLESTGKWHI